MKEKVCEKCKRFVEGKSCPVCKTSKLTTNWSGVVMIFNSSKSLIAKKLGADFPGTFALKVKGGGKHGY